MLIVGASKTSFKTLRPEVPTILHELVNGQTPQPLQDQLKP